MTVTLTLILAIVALVIALIAEFKAKWGSLLGYAVIVLALIPILAAAGVKV